MFFEHKAMYDEEVDVPDEAYAIPFGQANVTREGDDVTIVAFGRMVNFANEVADKLGQRRHLDHRGRPAHHLAARQRDHPGDVAETGRVVIVDEAHPRCNMATDISALVTRTSGTSSRPPRSW